MTFAAGTQALKADGTRILSADGMAHLATGTDDCCCGCTCEAAANKCEDCPDMTPAWYDCTLAGFSPACEETNDHHWLNLLGGTLDGTYRLTQVGSGFDACWWEYYGADDEYTVAEYSGAGCATETGRATYKLYIYYWAGSNEAKGELQKTGGDAGMPATITVFGETRLTPDPLTACCEVKTATDLLALWSVELSIELDPCQ